MVAVLSAIRGDKAGIMYRYKSTFMFFDTAEQARAFCDRQNTNRYIRQNHTSHYTPWISLDGKENAFVAWYVTK